MSNPKEPSSDRTTVSRQERDLPKKLKLRICLFAEDKQLVEAVSDSLDKETYSIIQIEKREELLSLIEDSEEKVDCLLLTDKPESRSLLLDLQKTGILLPIAIASWDQEFTWEKTTLYHPAEVKFELNKPEQITNKINLALTQFLNLTPHAKDEKAIVQQSSLGVQEASHLLTLQQRRLTEKLKERLGYLGVYYKRNSQHFYRNLTTAEREKLLKQLAIDYREIVLNYFEEEVNLNQVIDNFVHSAFFADISVSHILEIHMTLMDEFAQQLKLEGRSENILLDYRLALIDIVAHLCEMYRRCIPREDVSVDVLFKLD